VRAAVRLGVALWLAATLVGCIAPPAPKYTPTVTGVLTRNELSSGVRTGSAAVAGQFVLMRDGQTTFSKAFAAEHEWESSFIGAIAIPFAIDNYTATVQQLLGELFADPDFTSALHASGSSP
jgi:hypothetical protein